MGGAAAIITIYSDKTFETSMAYNKNMSDMSINFDFITEKDKLKRDIILKKWMKDNKKWMDKEYGQPGFAPQWYGLIIYDNFNKRIIEEQGYTGFMGAEIASLLLVQNESFVSGNEENEYTLYEARNIEKFLKANKLYLFNALTLEKELMDSSKSLKQIMKKFVKRNGSLNISFYIKFRIDHKGWKYICFDGGAGKKSYDKPFTAFYKYCQKNYSDFMTKKDHKKWKEYLDTHENQEE